jgi:mono/diheme cytochrome c family protein
VDGFKLEGDSMRRLFLIPVLLFQTGLQAQIPTKSLNELKAFFVANCVKCHGSDGSAHSAEGKKLGGRDFTDAEGMAKEKDESLAKTIRKGILFGMAMPAFKDRLSEADIELLIKEIVRKAEKGKVVAPAEEAPR